MKRILSLALLALALAFPVGAFAANHSDDSTETLTIVASFTLTGVPASISYTANYRSGIQTVTGIPAGGAAISWNSSYGAGTTLSVLASDFTGGVSPATIGASARQFVYNGMAGTTAAPNGVPTDGTTPLVIGDTSGVGNGSFTLESNVNLPAGAIGTYAGSLVFTVTQ